MSTPAPPRRPPGALPPEPMPVRSELVLDRSPAPPLGLEREPLDEEDHRAGLRDALLRFLDEEF